MTDVSTSRFGPKDHRDENLELILNHLYSHAVPADELDRPILPGMTKMRSSGQAWPLRLAKPFRSHPKALAAVLVAASIAVLIAANILPNPASSRPASAVSILRRSAVALVPPSGTAVHRVYSIHVPCPGTVPCPTAIGEVWTVNLKGTLVTYQSMRVTGVSRVASHIVGKVTSQELPGRPGGTSRISATVLAMPWLHSLGRQLRWPRNLEPAEYMQAWSALAQLNDAQSMTSEWLEHVQRKRKKGPQSIRVRRLDFNGAPSYQVRFPQQFPQATSASTDVLYIDAHTYAVRGVVGLTCPVFGKTYPSAIPPNRSARSARVAQRQVWVPVGCVVPRFVPTCFVDVGNSSTHVWVPRGCPTETTPFKAWITSSHSTTVCQAPRSLFAWYFRSHAGYLKACKRRRRPLSTSTYGTRRSISGDGLSITSGGRPTAPASVDAKANRTNDILATVRMGVGSWPQPRFNAARTAFNPLANRLSPANVSQLRLKWRAANFALSPVAANHLLYQAGQGAKSYIALRLKSHAVKWRVIPGGWVEMSPAVGRQFVYAPVPAALYALDPKTGQPKWGFFPPHHQVVTGTPVVSGTVVGVPICSPESDGPKFVRPSCALYAMNASTGKLRHVYADPDGVVPAISKGTVYLTSQGTVRAVRLATGRPMWTFRPPVGSNGQDHFAGSGLAVANGVVYAAGDGSDTVYAINETTGRELWWSRAGLQHGQFTDVAIAYGHVFVGQIGIGPKAGLYCLAGRTGRVIWHFKDNTGFEAGPSVANGVVYAADSAGTMVAIRASNGQRLWSVTFRHGGTAGDPEVADGLLLVEYGGRGVFAYGLPRRR